MTELRFNWTRRLKIATISVICLTVALYSFAVFLADYDKIRLQASYVPLEVWVLLISISLLSFLLRFSRWQLLIGKFGNRIPIPRHFMLYIAGFSLSTTPAKVGEAIRSPLMLRDGVAIRESVAALFAERLNDLLVISAMAILAASVFGNALIVIGLAMILIVSTSLFVCSPISRTCAEALLRIFSYEWLRSFLAALLGLFDTSRVLLQWNPFLITTIIGVVAWGTEATGFYILLQYLGIESSLFLAFGIWGISILIGALSFLPGGLGTTEATMTALLLAGGADSSSAIFATIAFRLVTLWFAVALGFIALFIVTKIGPANEP